MYNDIQTNLKMLSELSSPATETGKFLVVVHFAVGSLQLFKAEALCDRVLDKLRKGKPDDCLNFIVIPQRDYETWVEVFPLNGQDQPTDSIEAFVYDAAPELNE